MPSLPRVAASHPNLTPIQREAIYALKRKGKSGEEIRRVCARGTEVDGQAVPPFSVSGQHANTVARRLGAERGELYTSAIGNLEDGEALDALTARLIATAEREIQRQEQLQKRGRLDAAQVGKLATALAKLYGLAERKGETVRPPGGEVKAPEAVPDPPTLAEQLIADGGAEEDAPALGDVVVGANGGSFAREDRRPQKKGDAVPPAPEGQDTAEGPGTEQAAMA